MHLNSRLTIGWKRSRAKIETADGRFSGDGGQLQWSQPVFFFFPIMSGSTFFPLSFITPSFVRFKSVSHKSRICYILPWYAAKHVIKKHQVYSVASFLLRWDGCADQKRRHVSVTSYRVENVSSVCCAYPSFEECAPDQRESEPRGEALRVW